MVGRPTQGLAGTVPRNGSSVRYPCKSLPVWYVGKFRSSQPALCMAWCTLVQMGNLSVSAGLRYSDMFSVDLPLFVFKVFTHKKGVDVRNKGIWTRTLPIRHRFCVAWCHK